jgi:hypothetical protein
MTLSRKAILEKVDRVYKNVHIPIWNDDVRLQSMSAEEQLKFHDKVTTMKEMDVAMHLVVMSCVDEAGNKLFTENDVTALKEKNASAIALICEEAQKLNDMSKEDMENLAKN